MDEKNNSGDRNSGNLNSGHWNSGDWNSGNRNSGNLNSGHWNSGDWNSGNRNSGNRNSGHWNSGDWNSGNLNSGNLNSGHWNSGHWNSGFFNSNTPDEIRCFNKPCSREAWDNADKPSFIYVPSPQTWVAESDMSDQEKIDNKDFHVCGGYLRQNDMMDEWRKAYEGATEDDIQKCRDLPNFDYDVFEEITGLDLRPATQEPDCTGKVVEIDGVKYKLSKM